MKKAQRRRLFNLFAFALLAFAIYLITFYKEAPAKLAMPATNTASVHAAGTSNTP